MIWTCVAAFLGSDFKFVRNDDLLRRSFETPAAAAVAATATATTVVLRPTTWTRRERRDGLEATIFGSEAETRCSSLEKRSHNGQAGADDANVTFHEEPGAGVDHRP